MKVFVYENRDLNVIEEYSTQNENDFEVMEFKFSSLFDNYNKKIVFLTPDGNISYYIKNNKFSIPREITQYEQVKFYIWCTFEDKDFRTKLKILSFYKNENVNIDILPLEKTQIEQIINELEKNILIVQNLEKQTTNLIDEIETKLKNGDFVGPQGETGPQGPQGETGPQGPQGEPGESYDDTEIKEEISDIKEEQLTQNTDIETLQTQVADLEEQIQELENNQLTGTATGQSIYIEDSTNAKVRSIGLSGNSEQDNIAYIDTGSWEQGSIDGTNGSNISDNTYVRTADYIPVFPNILYNISRSVSTSYNVYRFYDSNKNYLGYHGTAGMITTNQESNRMVNGVSSMEMTIINTNVAYMRIADNSNNLSTVYTISTSAPNPSYPQEIHSTGDSGSVNEKVQNKNLFDLKGFLKARGVAYTENSDGSLTFTLSGALYSNPLQFSEENINVSLSGIITNGTATNPRIQILDLQDTTSGEITVDTQVRNNLLGCKLRFNYSTAGTVTMKNIQLEQGTTATDYVAHEEQNISFPLAQGQKLMQGDYLADDGIHHVRGEVVLDGTVGGYYADYNWFYISKSNITNTIKSFDLLSNYFKNINYATFESNTNLNGICWNNINLNNITHLLIRNTNCTNATEYKNWLAEVLPKVQFPLAEEQTEDFTEEQQAVWEQIKALRTYKPVTHISSTDEVPATVDVTYVKDLETVINNLEG